MGAIASLWVASKHPEAVDGVFSLSAVTYLPPFDLTAHVIHAIRVPKLFVAGATTRRPARTWRGGGRRRPRRSARWSCPRRRTARTSSTTRSSQGGSGRKILKFVESVPAG